MAPANATTSATSSRSTPAAWKAIPKRKLPFGKKRSAQPDAATPGATPRRRIVLRTFVCLALLAVLCIPAVFVNTILGYLPALFFILLVALCLAYCRICRRCFSFDEFARAESCVRGESVDVRLRIRNSSILFVPRVDVDFAIHDLFGNTSSSTRASIAVNPKADQDFSFSLSFGHIGQFSIGLEKLVIHDPLGLFEAQVPADSACTITVTPRLREVDDMPLSDTAAKQVSDALRPSTLPGSDYCGVRDYVPGDPMKLIHWKLSARGDTYYTKLYEEQSEPSLDIFLDLTAPEYDAEPLMDLYDAAIETALSLEAYAHEKGLETRVIFLNMQGEAEQFSLVRGSDFRNLMTRIPRISVASSEPFELLVRQHATTLRAADNIAVCSAHCTSGMAETLAQVRNTQRNALMFALAPIGASANTKAIKQSLNTLRQAGVFCFLVDAGGRP